MTGLIKQGRGVESVLGNQLLSRPMRYVFMLR